MSKSKPLISIKIRTACIVTIFLFCFSLAVFYLVDKIEKQVSKAYKTRSDREFSALFSNIIKNHTESLISWMRTWLVYDNLEILLSEPFDNEAWGNHILTIGNQISVRFGVSNIITFNDSAQLIYEFKTDDNAAALNNEQVIKMLSESIDSESIIKGVIFDLSDHPLLATVIPSENEDGDLSHFHLIAMTMKPILANFSEAITYDTTLDINGITIKDKTQFSYEEHLADSRSYFFIENQIYQHHSIALEPQIVSEGAILNVYANSTKLRTFLDEVKTTNILIISAVSIVFILLFTLIISILLNPLSILYEMSKKAATGDYSQRFTVKSNTEVGQLGETFNIMLEEIKKRSESLKRRTQDVKSILENIKQGIFTITPSNKIHHEYSDHLEEIMANNRIAGEDVIRFLFENSDLTSDRQMEVEAGLTSIIGDSEIALELNEHLLPENMKLETAGSDVKFIELNWDPIYSPEGNTEKIMVVLKDVTEVKKLKEKTRIKETELAIIDQIIQIKPGRLKRFLDDSHNKIFHLQELCVDRNHDMEAILRNLHTIKGNARTYGLSLVSEGIHHLESYCLEQIENNVNHKTIKKELSTKFYDLENILKKYQMVDQTLLKRSNRSNGENTETVISKLINILESGKSEPKKTILELINYLKYYNTIKLTELVELHESGLPSLASELKKEVPFIKVTGCNPSFTPEWTDVLMGAFSHLFRNCMDHGIENKEKRLAQGKDPAGTIFVDCKEIQGNTIIRFSDDGQGLNIEKIKETAINKGLFQYSMNIEELANLIFVTGLSTKKEVDSISGRGIGMDAIKQSLQEKGADIQIKIFNKNKGNNFCKFCIEISFKNPASNLNQSKINENLGKISA